MTLTIQVSDATWALLTERVRQIQQQVPGERPGEILIRPVYPTPVEWLEAVVDQHIQQHVPAPTDGPAALKIAQADALRREAESLIRQQRGIAVIASVDAATEAPATRR